MMTKITKADLLKNPDVNQEIQKHLWVESQKAGHDLGLAWASDDWIKRYAQLWLDYHRPGEKLAAPAAKEPARSSRSNIVDGTPDRIKKRRAKSYLR